MEANLNTLPEAQAEVEILNDKYPGKSLFKFEERLRKEILRLRNNDISMDAHEIQDLMEALAQTCNFQTHRIHYQSVTPAPDGYTMLQYEATLDKFHCFIYVRDL